MDSNVARTWRRLAAHRTAWWGGTVVALFLLTAIAAPVIAPYGVNARHEQLAPPSWRHPFGTDAHQYDVLTRVIYGSRLSLLAGGISIALAVLVGSTIGAVAGFLGGLIDTLMMRTVDIFLAFPSILIALLVVAAYRPGWPAVIVAVSMINIPVFARQVRATVLTVRSQEYVEASHALGATRRQILVRTILPAIINPIVVLGTLGLGTSILEVAGLAYLGIAGDPTIPEWGSMLKHAKEHLHASAWPAIAPGGAISLAILGLNLLGDGLRDALDPRGEISRH